MKVLITGSTGLIGGMLLRTAPWGTVVAGTFHTNRLVPDLACKYYHLDITDRAEVAQVFADFSPDLVIHTAAKATPDWCARNPAEAYRVNVLGSKNIIDQCDAFHARLIFLSSNAVFDGTKAPYTEESLPCPTDEYGRNKHEVEKYLLHTFVDHTIVRSMCVYGWPNPYERHNFTSLLLDRNSRGEAMQITKDVHCNFIGVFDLVDFIWSLADREEWLPFYHVAGSEDLTHWKLTGKIVSVFNLNRALVHPVKQADLKGYITRPTDTRFDCTRARRLGFSPVPIKEGLRRMRDCPTLDWRWL